MTQIYFTVTENTPGYLPEGEGGAHSSWEEAKAEANDIGRQLIEEGYKLISENEKHDLWYEAHYRESWGIAKLGRVVEINQVLV